MEKEIRLVPRDDTTIYLDKNENDYISFTPNDVMLRCGSRVIAFNSWSDLVYAIDISKAAWHDEDPERS